MADYSQSPVRRAQGYLTAMVEWGYFTQVYADQRYAEIRLQCQHESAGELTPIAVLQRTVTPEHESEFLLWRLCLGTPFASFCRGFPFALVEQGRYDTEAAGVVMHIVAERKSLDDRWLATFPRLQSHPLCPNGPKLDTGGDLRVIRSTLRHA